MATKVITHSSLDKLNQLVNNEFANGWRAVSGGVYNDGRGYYAQVLTDEIEGDPLPYKMIRFNSVSDFERKSAGLPGRPMGTPQLLQSNDLVQAFGGVISDVPVATSTTLGVVKADDKVSVAADGTMTVHGILNRVKSECWFTGLNLVIPTTPTNLIALIKNLSYSGTLLPFFNGLTDKFNVSNFDTSVNFKINLIGTWSGASTNRSVTIDFPQTNGNALTKTRDAAVTSDQISMSTFFSVDKDGNLATNGSDITVKANGAVFTVTSILLIAEQLIPS